MAKTKPAPARPRPKRGRAAPQRAPRKKKKPQPKSKLQRFLLRYGWLLPVGAILVGIGILVLTYAFAAIPLPQDIKLASSAQVFDRNGNEIGTYSDEIKRFLLDTDELDELLEKKPYIAEAVIAAEDRQFFDHNGVSIRGIIRAGWANLTGGEVAQGGSTITQQYVKNAVLADFSRTITRKAKEAILAIKLERRYSKKEILGFYLNTIYLGRGAYGFEAAANVYFDKTASELNLGQAAYLAGIIPAPGAYQPDEEPEAATARRNRVLDLMASEGYISEEQAEKASRGRIKLRGNNNEADPPTSKAAYFMEWLRKDYLYPEFKDELYTRGLKIHTTLDMQMQRDAETAIKEILTEKNDPQAALVSMTPKGDVRAFVGGRAFRNIKTARGFNYASDFPGRQAGSAFKPWTLLAAIEEGISPSSTFSGASPQLIPDPCAGETGLPPWEVDNYGDASYGSMTLGEATTQSVNTVYAQLIQEVGPENVVEMLNELQFDRDDMRKGERREISPDCGLALGILDVTPLEMTRAFAGMAGRGRLPQVVPITYIEDAQGNCVREYRARKGDCEKESTPESKQVVPQNSADVLNDTLTSVVESGTATVANIGRPVAGKTGTTQNNGNAWFAGYTPQLVTVVWEGYPLEEKGGRAVVPEMRYCSDTFLCRPVQGYEVTGGGAPVSPAVIWANFMTEAVEGMEVLDFPTPVDIPDEVINKAPTVPTTTSAPEPAEPEAPEPEETEEPEPEPSEEPEPEPSEEPEPEPTEQPTIGPTPTPPPGRSEEEEP